MSVSFLVIGIDAVDHYFYIDPTLLQILRVKVDVGGIFLELARYRCKKV